MFSIGYTTSPEKLTGGVISSLRCWWPIPRPLKASVKSTLTELSMSTKVSTNNVICNVSPNDHQIGMEEDATIFFFFRESDWLPTNWPGIGIAPFS